MEETSSQTTRIKRFKNSHKIVAALILLLLISNGLFIQLYSNSRKQVNKLQNPQNAVKLEADDLKAKVGQLVDLPDEEPTVATVSDISKLKGQAFFEKAQNGDKVLIFANAQRAVLYRPSTNKVIEFSPVNLGTAPTGTTTTKK